MYNKQVKLCTFQDGDLVLGRVFENTANLADGKFQQNWEGPYTVVLVGVVGSYTVVRVGAVGSYLLNNLDGTPVPRMWKAMHLKRNQ